MQLIFAISQVHVATRAGSSLRYNWQYQGLHASQEEERDQFRSLLLDLFSSARLNPLSLGALIGRPAGRPALGARFNFIL